MSDALYHDRMLELAAASDRPEALARPDAEVTLDNPLCGDRVTLALCADTTGAITGLSHQVRGCVLCRAATAVLAAHAVGHDAAGLERVRTALQQRLRAGAQGTTADTEESAADAWPALTVFAPVAPHKSRHECVLLPFDAALEALAACPRPHPCHRCP